MPDHIRPRVCSLPEKPYNPRSGDDLYRLRTFSITKGTVINCGDSIINRRSRSNTSVNSAGTRLVCPEASSLRIWSKSKLINNDFLFLSEFENRYFGKRVYPKLDPFPVLFPSLFYVIIVIHYRIKTF